MGTLFADPECLALARTSDPCARLLTGLPLQELKHARAAILHAQGPWERIRAWRAVGVSVGVIVLVDDDDAPEDRPRLEPLVLMRRADTAGLKEALDRLAVGEAKTQMPLAKGLADFHRGLFERDDGTTAKLTGLEVRLLAYLAARSFRVVGRQELQEQVWGYKASLDTKTVEMTVARLRKKIGQESVLTIRGEGYRAVRIPPRQTPPEGSPTSDPLLLSLRRGATLMMQHGQNDEAERILDLHARTRAPGDEAEEAEERILRSRLRFVQGDLASAEACARRALSIAHTYAMPPLEASASCVLAPVLRLLGRRDEGLTAIETALRIFGTLDDDAGRVRALALRADFETGAAAHTLAEEALEAWQRGRTQYDEGITAQPLHAALLMRVATGKRLAGQLQEARHLYARAADIYDLLGNDINRAQALLGVASTAFDLGDDATCQAQMAAAFPCLRQAKAKRVRAQAEAFAAVVSLVTGDVASGLRQAQHAVELLGVGTGTIESSTIDVILAAAQLANGNPALARDTLQTLKTPAGAQFLLAHVVGWLKIASAAGESAKREAYAALPPPARYGETRFTAWAQARAQAS